MTAIVQPKNNALFDLSSRTTFRVSGSDSFRFLNGQITNDLRKASEIAAIEACVLSAKGKINAHLFISVVGDCFQLDAEPELRATLAARLDRYIIADDVQVEDVTGRFAIFHVIGEALPVLPNEWRTIRASRFGRSGWDIWIDNAERDTVRAKLSTAFPLCDVEAAEIFRIETGTPKWGRELTEEIIPIEANLEARAIDYEKGCYIGQEVISRIKMSGQINKRLVGFVALSETPLVAGMRLRSVDEEKKDVGWITSAVRSDRLNKQIALGYAKRGFNSIGMQLEAHDADSADKSAAIVRVKIVDLPFV
jgi:tRNA-modifying protein YgfZ